MVGYLQHWEVELALVLLLLDEAGLFLGQGVLVALFWLDWRLLLVVLVFFSVVLVFGRVLVLILVVVLALVLVVAGVLPLSGV